MQEFIDYVSEATKPIFIENNILQNAARELFAVLDSNDCKAYALLAI